MPVQQERRTRKETVAAVLGIDAVFAARFGCASSYEQKQAAVKDTVIDLISVFLIPASPRAQKVGLEPEVVGIIDKVFDLAPQFGITTDFTYPVA